MQTYEIWHKDIHGVAGSGAGETIDAKNKREAWLKSHTRKVCKREGYKLGLAIIEKYQKPW